MILFRKKNQQLQLNNLHNLLAASFGNVKRDTSLIFQWLHFFNQKFQHQDSIIKQLQSDIQFLPKKEDIRQIIDETDALRDVDEKIKTFEQKLNLLVQGKPSFEPHVGHKIEEKLENMHLRLQRMEDKKAGLKEKIIRQITKRSKDYISSVILSYIKKYQKISALQLKEIVVEEQALCSKSSFYRIVAELESNDEIAILKQGKEKHYLAKLSKKSNV